MEKIIDGKDLGKFIPKMELEWVGYYFIDDFGDVALSKWVNDDVDKWRLKHYKLFRTAKECEDYKWFLEMVDKYSYEFSLEEWKDSNIVKYVINYNHSVGHIYCTNGYFTQHVNNVCFKSVIDRTNFIKEVGEERIMKYMFDIWKF